MRDAGHSESELLKLLHRRALVQLTALKQLRERSPEDDLRLRESSHVVTRLMDRIQRMEAREPESASTVSALAL